MKPETGKNHLRVHEPESESQSTSQSGSGAPTSRKSWMNKITLAIAIIALLLALQQKLSSDRNAIKSINQTITNTVLPQVKKSSNRDMVDTVYELKEVMITLEKIKETSTNPEVKSRIDQLQKDIQELSVKIIVHE